MENKDQEYNPPGKLNDKLLDNQKDNINDKKTTEEIIEDPKHEVQILNDNHNTNNYNGAQEEKNHVNDNDKQQEEEQKVNLQKALKTVPKFVCCPYCKQQGVTKVETKCSVLTGVLSVIGIGLFWMVCQACRGKDINCNDAEHYCVRCGGKLASYKST